MDLIVGQVFGQPGDAICALACQGPLVLHAFPSGDTVNTFLGPMPKGAADWLGTVTNVNINMLGTGFYGTQNADMMARLLGRKPPATLP